MTQGNLTNRCTATKFLHTLAFAANQDSGHGVGGFAGLGYGWVGAVPAGAIHVVTGGAAFAVAALSASSAVQDDFVRAGGPVFIDVEIVGFGGGCGGLGHQAHLRGGFFL